jgi:hypothetical protein
MKERLEAAADLALAYGQVDGEQHKMWVIDQMLRILLGVKYDYAVGEDWKTGEHP